MKSLKILSILAIIFSFSQCGSTHFESNVPFVIDSAIYLGWSGGQPGVSGINVTINLKTKSTIEFDSLYFRQKSVKVKVKESSIILAAYNTSKNLSSDIILNLDPKKELKNKIPKQNTFPFKLKENEAVLSYHLEGKIRYFKIKNLTAQDSNAYPKIQ